MFEHYGLIRAGTTLVGYFQKDQEQQEDGPGIQVGVALVEDLSEIQKKRVLQDARASLSAPDITVCDARWSATLHQSFQNVADPVLNIPVGADCNCAGLVRDVISGAQGVRRMLFACATRRSYLEICSALGLSRGDFLHVAELKALLPGERVREDSILGRAHDLIQDLNEGMYVPGQEYLLPAGQKEVARSLKYVAGLVERAKKIVVTSSKDAFTEEVCLEKNVRLPFEAALFQYTGESVSTDGTENKFLRMLLVRQEQETPSHFKHSGLLFQYEPDIRQFVCAGYGPGWITDAKGQFLGGDVVSFNDTLNPVLSRIFSNKAVELNSFGAMARVFPAIALLNEPCAESVMHRPPAAANRKRQKNGRVPFFESYEVDPWKRKKDAEIPESLERREAGAAEGGGSTALHLVRGHSRRDPSGDQTWIGWHPRGNPENGVVVSSFMDQSKRQGPPARTLG